MDYFSIEPSEGSIKVSLFETISEDCVVSHEYFLSKMPKQALQYKLDSSDTILLEQPIWALEEAIAISRSNRPEPQVQEGMNFLSMLDQADRSLWMEKYQADKFSDLVTDIMLNRDALAWLYSWNEIVFKNKKAKVPAYYEKKMEKAVVKGVLIISGPPGCGKTTLARCIAMHANYDPHEINAAMIGSGKELLETLKNCLSIQSVALKPGMLIIDQVETLDKQTLKTISEMMSSKTLKRPIIAITNDLYTPSLIPLRNVSYVLHCKYLNPENLYDRLKEICEVERVFIPETHLRTIIKENKSDLRSCINSLQLLGSGRAGRQLNISASDLAIANSKRSNPSIFDVWKQIFTEPNSKSLKKTILSFGDIEIINSGIFENYPQSRYTDYTLEKTVTLLDTLSFNDTVNQRVHESQQYELYTFQILPGLLANRLCSSSTIDLSFPISEKKNSKEVIESFEALSALRSRNLTHPSKITLMQDVYSFASYILGNENFGVIKEILLELGFEINKDVIVPEIKRIVRIPSGFCVRIGDQEAKESKDSKYGELSQKRKRNTRDGVVFVYHEGLTNAVRRRVKVSDLM